MNKPFVPGPSDDEESVSFLRKWANHWDQYGTNSTVRAFRRSADELERLRAEVAEYKRKMAVLENGIDRFINDEEIDGLVGILRAASAENAELRAHLDRIRAVVEEQKNEVRGLSEASLRVALRTLHNVIEETP